MLAVDFRAPAVVVALAVLACAPAKPSSASDGAGAGTGSVGPGGSDGASGRGTTASGGSGTAGTHPDASGGRAGVVGGASGAAGMGATGGAEPDPSADVYDSAQFPRFDFELSEASLSTLRGVQSPEDPAQDTYVTATFTYDKGGANEVVSNVGLRIKGEGSFLPFDQKPALKVKFDKFVDKQRFRGLARLTLNNNYDDPSFVAERLAYDVYRAAGVPAPRCNSAQVFVNGEPYGVYTNLESEDKHLLKRWFPSDGGNLYEKDGMGDFTSQGAADFQLETNETKNDRSDLNELIAAIQGATEPATFLTSLEPHLDTAELLKFTAVEAAVNQWDSHSFTIWWPHNFRIYHDPTAGKFSFIPWGHDLSMKRAPFTRKTFVEPFELAHASDDANQPITSGILFQRCLASSGCKAAYKTALAQVTDVYERLKLKSVALRYYEQIKVQVHADERKRVPEGMLSNDTFDAAFEDVTDVIEGRVAALRAALAAN